MNVSRTGLLFENDWLPAVGTLLEIVLEFGPPLASVWCSGRVVRTSVGERSAWAVAVTILHYRVIEQSRPDFRTR